MARVTTRAIVVMRQDIKDGIYCRGLIVNISSLAGIYAFPGHAYYYARKWAVEGWTESVAKEVHPDWKSEPLFPFFNSSPIPVSLHLSSRLRISKANEKTVNFCIVEPSGVKAEFEGYSKAHIAPHPAYVAPDMPARILEAYINKGIKAGTGAGMIEPDAVAQKQALCFARSLVTKRRSST
jgi:hypothetical protein